MWEWLAGLDLEKAANAVVILLAGTLAAFGFRGGKVAPAPKAPDLAVAADFFDAEAIKRLTAEVTGQAIAITAQAKATEAQTVAVREQTEAIEEAGRSLVRLAKEVEEHRHEMGRRR